MFAKKMKNSDRLNEIDWESLSDLSCEIVPGNCCRLPTIVQQAYGRLSVTH